MTFGFYKRNFTNVEMSDRRVRFSLKFSILQIKNESLLSGDCQHRHLLRPEPSEHGGGRGPGVGERLLRDARLRRDAHFTVAAAHRARPQTHD